MRREKQVTHMYNMNIAETLLFQRKNQVYNGCQISLEL